tara:strand:+ start:198 stop:590 length:393 start_codon:yes stop_codon:yes gene_type:complete
MLTYLIWFLAGALAHRLLSFFLAVRLEKHIISQTLLITGKLFKAISIDIERILAFKHDAIKYSDLPDQIIKKTIDSDREFIAKWQMLLFTTVAMTIPTKYIKTIPNYIWDERIDLNSIVTKLEEENNEQY